MHSGVEVSEQDWLSRDGAQPSSAPPPRRHGHVQRLQGVKSRQEPVSKGLPGNESANRRDRRGICRA